MALTPAAPAAPPASAGDPGPAPGGGLGCTLRIDPAGWQATVPPGSTLLQAAEAAGILLPSSCRNGTCRACRCRMASGSVAYTVDWPGLSREEKAEGEVLPCVALARSDVILVVPGARRS